MISRPPLDRMRHIARLIMQGKTFTCVKLADELEISRKTVERDIDFMRDRLGYQIEFCQSRNSWFGRPPRERIL
jgi:proteasome accessory factor B